MSDVPARAKGRQLPGLPGRKPLSRRRRNGFAFALAAAIAAAIVVAVVALVLEVAGAVVERAVDPNRKGTATRNDVTRSRVTSGIGA